MKFTKSGRCAPIFGAIVYASLAIPTPAFAGPGGGGVSYNEVGQDLGAALTLVARRSGREIIFGADAVRGKQAPALEGNFTADQAVRLLLVGSGLVADYREDVILIRGRAGAANELDTGSPKNPDIVVTGTHIRGTQSPSPTTVVDRNQIERQGITDLGSFARTIPQNFNGGQNPGVRAQGGQTNLNSSTALNLRGLGPDATLTLINGHRVAYDGVVQGVDISAIPLAAIERLEVVTDGASALYGSDAVAGVANIVLRKSFSGLVTSARVGGSTDGGNFQQQYNAVLGHEWNSGNLMAIVDYSHNSAITAGQRSYTKSLYRDDTVLPMARQWSSIVTANKSITENLSIDVDGYYNSRYIITCTDFSITAPCTTTGTQAETHLRAYGITPTLKLALPGSWRSSLSGSYGKSNSIIYNPLRSNNVLLSVTRPKYYNNFKTVEVNADGPLLRLPGGDVSVAIGAGYRNVSLDVDLSRNVGGTITPLYLFNTKNNVYFGYSEVMVPLVGAENARSFAQEFSITGAIRYEDYLRVAKVATPKFGFVFKPHSDVVIKGSWGKSFAAADLFQAGQPVNGTLLAGSYFVPTSPGGKTVLLLTGGNEQLQPQRATTWTVTFGLAPRFVQGFRAEVSYFNIQYKNRVAVPLSSSITAFNKIYARQVIINPNITQVNAAIAAISGQIVNQSGGTFDPAAVGAIVDDTLQNLSRQTARGVDVQISYDQMLNAIDKIQFNAAASYLNSNRQLISGQAMIDLAGHIFNPPAWRARASVGWHRDAFDLTGTVNYLGGTLDDRFAPATHIGSFTTFDLAGIYRTDKDRGPLGGIDITIGLQNLLNKKPGVIRTTNATDFSYDSTNYSSLGRTANVTISKAW